MKRAPQILVVKLSALGDIIHTIPVVAGIKAKYPDASISWVVSRPYDEVLQDNPDISQLFIFERKRWGGLQNFAGRFGEFGRLLRRLRQARFDIVLDFQGLLRSAILTLAAGAPRRIGFANARELAPLAYTEWVVPENSVHAIARYRQLASCLGNIELPQSAWLPQSVSYRAKLPTWPLPRPLIVLVPGARWESKCWPPGHFARLAEQLIAVFAASVVLVGSSAERLLGETIMQIVPTTGRVHNLIGQTSLAELAGVIAQADFVVTNDSGPMHIACALGRPTLALFGPTDPVRTGPYGAQSQVIRAQLPCVPCFQRECKKSPFCLATISPETVLQAVQLRLNRLLQT